MTNDPLQPPRYTDRGLPYYPPTLDLFGGDAVAHGSSNADGPAVWLKVSPARETRRDSASAHLGAPAAWLLARQLMSLVVGHYQGDARPADYEPAALDVLAAGLAAGAHMSHPEHLHGPARELLDHLHRAGFALVKVTPDE